MQGSALQGARLIFRREVACAMRSRSSWAAMFMFSLTDGDRGAFLCASLCAA